MKFKKIKILGFKSFVDPTELDIDEGLTGIVGPNGCGKSKFLEDGMEVSIEFYDEKPMNVNPPESLTVQIAETEAVVKGQTASSSYKPALLTNGVRVTVPPHIETGDKIRINTSELTYIEKAK